MFARRYLSCLSYPALVILLFLITSTASSQTPEPTPPAKPADDVVKVFTELVQTDVMVFDKQGRFVDGLTKDKFEVKIDGQSRPIQFFEQIASGTKNEDAQLAAARGNPVPTDPGNTRVVPLDRGRTIFFYVDDFHLDPAGFSSSRKITITTRAMFLRYNITHGRNLLSIITPSVVSSNAKASTCFVHQSYHESSFVSNICR